MLFSLRLLITSFPFSQCPECDWVVNATLPLIELEAINVIPRVTAGFHQRLRANTVVLKRSLIELKDYHRVRTSLSSKNSYYRSNLVQDIEIAHIQHRQSFPLSFSQLIIAFLTICGYYFCQLWATNQSMTNLIPETYTYKFLLITKPGYNYLNEDYQVTINEQFFMRQCDFNMLQPFGGGAFQRGEVFNPAEGRFAAPRQGIYQFVVNIHLVHEGYRSKSTRKLRRRDNVKVSICIQSLCQKHT